MDVQLILRLLSCLLLGGFVGWFFRTGGLEAKAQARRLRELTDYARSRQLALAPHPSIATFSMTGSFEGAALTIDTPKISSGKGVKTITRVRVQLAAGEAYRGAAPSESRFVLARRGQSVTLESIARLSEIGSGDSAFDLEFSGYASPGATPPWASPAFRAGLLDLQRTGTWNFDRLERDGDECSVILSRPVWEPPALDRAIHLASAMVDPERARRLETSLSQPLAWRKPDEIRRAEWHWVPIGFGAIGGFVLMFVGPYVNPAVRELVGLVACDEGAAIQIVRQGKSSNLVCIAANGGRDGANLWGMFVSFGVHSWLIAAVVIVVRAIRSRPQT